jgi:hypothetical protein
MSAFAKIMHMAGSRQLFLRLVIPLDTKGAWTKSLTDCAISSTFENNRQFHSRPTPRLHGSHPEQTSVDLNQRELRSLP